jgi:hypothetical protein
MQGLFKHHRGPHTCAGVAQVRVGGAVPHVHVVPGVEGGVLRGVGRRDAARLQRDVGHLRQNRPCGQITFRARVVSSS